MTSHIKDTDDFETEWMNNSDYNGDLLIAIDINTYITTASEEQIEQLAEKLGIEITYDEQPHNIIGGFVWESIEADNIHAFAVFF
jgi:hypothetical protein